MPTAAGKKGSKKKMLKRKRLQSSSQSDGEPQQPVAKVGKKRGRKRKGTEEGNSTKSNKTTPLTVAPATATSHVKNSNLTATPPSESVSTSEPALKVAEISPFERVPTYKCQYCPKRTQSLERIERHLTAEHSKDKAGSEDESGYRVLTRDQVVDILTLQRQKRQSSSSLASKLATLGGAFQTDYVCFYCDDVGGSIYEVKSHFKEEHDPTNDKFKVKRSQAGKKVGKNILLLHAFSNGLEIYQALLW